MKPFFFIPFKNAEEFSALNCLADEETKWRTSKKHSYSKWVLTTLIQGFMQNPWMRNIQELGKKAHSEVSGCSAKNGLLW